ncbi:MAG TPA: TatD family deoxyribonuclease [Flavobacteriales bacterium]|jgi:TatD DNase family protein|nr:TatD family deoxyribonuclease [Flavobacteriales bacterium]
MFYYDIHTHHDISDAEVISIKNVIAGRDPIPSKPYFSIGVHPWYLNKDALDVVTQNIQKNNCLALGEAGLDAMPQIVNQFNLDLQQDYFIKQVELSEAYAKPLIIHCVKCFDKLLHLKKILKPKQFWISHGFQKNKELAEQLIKAGFYLSFGAALFNSKNAQASLKTMPINRLFFETDSQTNYNIKSIYQQASFLLSLDLEDLKQHIASNFQNVFLSK